MPNLDIPSAARCVAEHARTAAAYGEGGTVLDKDLRTLLPVLDAVAVGQDDEARTERWRELIREYVPDRWGPALDDFARAAIALADAERAAGRVASSAVE